MNQVGNQICNIGMAMKLEFKCNSAVAIDWSFEESFQWKVIAIWLDGEQLSPVYGFLQRDERGAHLFTSFSYTGDDDLHSASAEQDFLRLAADVSLDSHC